MVDGVSGTDLMTLLLDSSPEPSEPLADTWAPQPEPSDAALAFDALVQLAVRPSEQARAFGAIVRRPRSAVTSLTRSLQGLVSLGGRSAATPALSIVGSIGPHRRWAAARSSLADIKEIRDALGGTVNDVVLAAISGAFRDLLLAAGDHLDGVVLHSLVPVNIRQAGDLTANNQVSVIIAELPVGIADPVERLHAVRADMTKVKAAHQADAGKALTSIVGLAPPTVFSLSLRTVGSVMRRMPQRNVNTVTTNVQGPAHALYALGRQLLDYLPFVPLSQGVRVGVAILSYNGHIAFGVTGDFDTVPSVEWFCRRIEAAITDLRERARTEAGAVAPAGKGSRIQARRSPRPRRSSRQAARH